MYGCKDLRCTVQTKVCRTPYGLVKHIKVIKQDILVKKKGWQQDCVRVCGVICMICDAKAWQ